MKQLTRSFFLAIILSLPLTSTSAGAAENEVVLARQYVARGDAHFQAGRFQDAHSEFMKAFHLLRWPTIALEAARTLERTGRLVEAANLYREAISLRPNDTWPSKAENRKLLENAQIVAQAELTTLSTRIPDLKVRINAVSVNDFEVFIDGELLPADTMAQARQANPGSHTVIARANDGRKMIRDVTLAEGDHQVVILEEVMSPPVNASTPPVPRETNPATPNVPGVPPKHEARRDFATWGWIGLGVGTVGIALGTTAGILSLAKKSELEQDGCNTNYQCDPATLNSGRMRSYDRWRAVSVVGFATGGVFAAAGITLLSVQSRQATARRVWVTTSADYLSLRGTF